MPNPNGQAGEALHPLYKISIQQIRLGLQTGDMVAGWVYPLVTALSSIDFEHGRQRLEHLIADGWKDGAPSALQDAHRTTLELQKAVKAFLEEADRIMGNTKAAKGPKIVDG